MVTRRLRFYLHRGVGEGAAPFRGLLHFTLDPHFIMLSAKQVFGMTRPGIEPRYAESLVITKIIGPMGRSIVRKMTYTESSVVFT